MSNLDVRQYAKEKGVCLWQCAEVLGISEPTMTRKLRRELPEDEKARLCEIIDRLAEGKEVTA